MYVHIFTEIYYLLFADVHILAVSPSIETPIVGTIIKESYDVIMK